MGGIAFVFSGQGDQFPGMGKDIYDSYPEAREVFRLCDEIRPGTSAQCFEGSEEELRETANTQPCLFAFEMAAAAVLQKESIKPDCAAGFSLGELAAATSSGLMDLSAGFRLVCRRGLLMGEAAKTHDSFMAAVLKLSPEKLKEICGAFEHVYPVNFNCPGQISVSGAQGSREEFFKAVKAVGGTALPIKVQGAFHSPFMRKAAENFGEELKGINFGSPHTPLYSNVSGDLYGADAADLLARQICSPVLWEKTVRNMAARGVSRFVEVGPGRILCNMIKKTDSGLEVYSVSQLPELLSEVKKC